MYESTERDELDHVDLGAATERTNGIPDLYENEGWYRPNRKSM